MKLDKHININNYYSPWKRGMYHIHGNLHPVLFRLMYKTNATENYIIPQTFSKFGFNLHRPVKFHREIYFPAEPYSKKFIKAGKRQKEIYVELTEAMQGRFSRLRTALGVSRLE